MARPRSEVRLSFDEDTVRLRANNWSDSFACELSFERRDIPVRQIEEVWPSWQETYLGDPLPDSFVVDWRDTYQSIEESQLILRHQIDEAYLREAREDFGFSAPELEERQIREVEPHNYWTPTYMGPIRHYEEGANSRAQALLFECLSPSQKVEFLATQSFTVVSKSKRSYRIGWGKNYNVTLLDNRVNYCAGPLEDVPIADMMLAQKLMLENDEDRFLKIANKQEDALGELVRGIGYVFR